MQEKKKQTAPVSSKAKSASSSKDADEMAKAVEREIKRVQEQVWDYVLCFINLLLKRC